MWNVRQIFAAKAIKPKELRKEQSFYEIKIGFFFQLTIVQISQKQVLFKKLGKLYSIEKNYD